MKTPLSEKQLAANRANAARSTGPRSAEGKARASMNARKHGFCGTTYSSVCFDDFGILDNLREDAIHDYQPITAQETQAVERIALHQLQILRAARLEAGLFEAAMRHGAAAHERMKGSEWPPTSQEAGRMQHDNLQMADGFDILLSRWNGWQVFLRYQAQAERLYRKAVEDFERLKLLRDVDLPNEPISDPQPEQNEEPEALLNEPTEPREAGLQAGHACLQHGIPAGIAPEVLPAAAAEPPKPGCRPPVTPLIK